MPELLTYYNAATGQQIAIGVAIAVLLLVAGAAAFRRLKP